MFRFFSIMILFSFFIKAEGITSDSSASNKNTVIPVFPIGSPEYLTDLALKYSVEENWKAYADILDINDLEVVKNIFDYLVNKDTTNDILTEFNFEGSKESFFAVSPIEFFPMFMSFIYRIQPQLSSAISSTSSIILGTVDEGDLTHVLTRKKVESLGMPFEQLEIITVIKKEDKYYIKMKDNIKVFAEQLKKMLGNE